MTDATQTPDDDSDDLTLDFGALVTGTVKARTAEESAAKRALDARKSAAAAAAHDAALFKGKGASVAKRAASRAAARTV